MPVICMHKHTALYCTVPPPSNKRPKKQFQTSHVYIYFMSLCFLFLRLMYIFYLSNYNRTTVLFYERTSMNGAVSVNTME